MLKLKIWYPIKKGILKRTVNYVKAINMLDFGLKYKETLGIVGESGSGKSTIANAIINLIDPPGEITSGSIKIDNETGVRSNCIWSLSRLFEKLNETFQERFVDECTKIALFDKEPSVMEEAKTALDSMGMESFYN